MPFPEGVFGEVTAIDGGKDYFVNLYGASLGHKRAFKPIIQSASVKNSFCE